MGIMLNVSKFASQFQTVKSIENSSSGKNIIQWHKNNIGKSYILPFKPEDFNHVPTEKLLDAFFKSAEEFNNIDEECYELMDVKQRIMDAPRVSKKRRLL